ncbi:hypothetical protein N0B31_07475 [Salinirubellus salinus]|jgi:hypothetical protein|uniref:Uncharacterized protein n=1 Tax=Salinirubellus salinus TaxID=1364945 RepID=A0A9E7R7M7_9EURY|nr:hypothetical protein [Salinirubellus salinus]UWM56123.1 hypothetical protein N0B31_07475 [Salinirubellus salinus]
MALRGVPRLVGGLLFQSATNDAERHWRAVTRNTKRVLGRPVRTTLSAVFVFGMACLLYVVAYRNEAALAAMDATGGELTFSLFLSLLPSPLLLVPAFVAFWILTVFALISSGVERDLGHHYR